MLYNSFYFHRTLVSRFFTLFPLRPLTLFSAHKSLVQHLTYWHRLHTSKARLPILFVYGISVGLYPYTNFLCDINKTTEAEDNAKITHPALEKDAMIYEIQAILRYHSWSKCILVSHSYGSIISTHLLKSPLTAPLIGPIILVNPVSFLLHLLDVAYNFTARQPVHVNEYLLWYFGSKDIGVAYTIARKFFWSENILWKEDLGVKGKKRGEGRNVTVVLSGKDLIVNTETVGQYLAASSSQRLAVKGGVFETLDRNGRATFTKIGNEATAAWKARPWTGSGLEILWFDHLDHGQVFDFEETRKPLIKAIGVYSAKGSVNN